MPISPVINKIMTEKMMNRYEKFAFNQVLRLKLGKHKFATSLALPHLSKSPPNSIAMPLAGTRKITPDQIRYA